MTRIEMVVNELVKRFESANWNDITLTMKCNNEEITISPCYYGDGIPTVSDIEYYLVYCSMPWSGNDSLEKIAKFLINYEKELNRQEEEKEKLHQYYVQYVNTSEMDWDWYSDWHKDVYGYRPRHGEH